MEAEREQEQGHKKKNSLRRKKEEGVSVHFLCFHNEEFWA